MALCGVVLGVSLWAYWPAVQYPFQFDDQLFLNDTNVRRGEWRELVWPPTPRFATWLTFLAQMRLSGPEPTWFHGVNLLLHLINTILVFLVLRKLFVVVDVADRNGLTSAVGTAFFSLHPVQVESVVYVYQRSTLLAAAFALTATWIWLRREDGDYRLGWILGLFYLAALASKEYVVLLPLFWWVADRPRQRGLGAPVPLRVSLALMLGAVVAAPIWLAASDPAFEAGWVQRWEYLCGQATVFWLYVALILGLAPLNLDHHVNPLAPASPGFWLAAGGILATAGAAIAVRKRRPELTVPAAAVALFLLPTSSLAPSADWAFEHRLYLAMLGFAGLGAVLLQSLAAWMAETLSGLGRLPDAGRLTVAVTLVCAITAALAVAARDRVEVWKTPVALWADAQRKSPEKYRPNFNLGVLLMRESPARARLFLKRAIALHPGQPEAYRSLGQLELEQGFPGKARELWQAALRLDPSHAETHAALGQLEASENDFSEAVRHLKEAVRLDPSLPSPYHHLAQLHLRFGFAGEAVKWAERGLQRHPESAGLWLLLAEAVSQQANWERAAELYREALKRDPNLEAARRGLARARSHLPEGR